MTTLLVNLIGIALIGLIIWWFWFSTPKTRKVADAGLVEIIVEDGVYTPAKIEVPKGRPITLRFIRKDPSPCAEKVLFTDFDISADLEIGEPQEITITPDKSDEYEFTCQMGMYRGRLIVN